METKFDANQEESELKQLASRKVIKLKSFYKQLFIYTIVLIVFLLKEYTELPLNFFPIKFINNIVMILWTTVVVGSAIDVFTSYKIFDEEWEARKIKSILGKRNKKQKWE